MASKTVDIRPGVSVLSVLRHLNYKPWFALGEFVDNAVQSYLDNKESLRRLHGEDFKLNVHIDIDDGPPARMSIRDNAAGIEPSVYPRAFRPAVIPTSTSGLSEFGMGMKSAACWFSPRWSVRTSSIEECTERLVSFDIQTIVADSIEELDIAEKTVDRNTHYTEVVLDDLYQKPYGRTLGKIKDHLTDIYRDFIRRGILDLYFRGERLEYEMPGILVAPYYREPESEPIRWIKEIDFDLGGGLSAHGFAALRERGNTSKAGFALFRRGRVIEGSGDDGYRPKYIFGQTNSYRYQRLFGELHLEGFEVSHTKDGFRWDDNEQPFLELLRDHLESGSIPLLRQAENYRARARPREAKAAADRAAGHVAQVLQSQLSTGLENASVSEPSNTDTQEPTSQEKLATRSLDIEFRGREWHITLDLTSDQAESEWLKVISRDDNPGGRRSLWLQVSLAHPFMVRFAQTDSEDIEAVCRIAAALGVAEVLAKDAGVPYSGTVRRKLNDLLRDALSGPS